MSEARSLTVIGESVERGRHGAGVSVAGDGVTTGVSRSGPRGSHWTSDIDTRMARLEQPVRDLIGPVDDSLAEADEITIVPDVHYPFHPSTGMVTDPAVIGAVTTYLGGETSSNLVVAGSSDDSIDFDRTAAYLGYTAIEERFDCRLHDLSTERDSRITVSLPDRSETIELSVPDSLLENPVVVVPTLRPVEAGPVAGVMRTLGCHVESGVEGREISAALRARAAVNAIDPDLSILDATTAFAGEPFAAETLFTGEAIALDTIGTTLLGRDVNDDEALSAELGPGTSSVRVSGCDFDSLRNRVPSGGLPPRTSTHPAVSVAYGLYAMVSGDAVPPQLEVDR
ncbi:hypothetical protein HALLA_20740 (plasmid) [Halostagnicola larsenii XH-48]|uniref:DUF362 domain-containing protein n=1 Tax=Halostagnicola larsenii XH-48 TaxID=797299 RepID=W0JZF9_9EURY|nr:DUF362 domain-containing protein [Halostagnicola larsenii]AHG02333.1 hypothetical protein HALLA_20740 [Halostagnicola larsenii XH-48]